MRRLAILATTLLVGAVPAAADTRVFIIANAPDAYGVDQCLASGARCGNLVANSYCRTQAYMKAVSFRKAEQADVTGATPVFVSGSWNNRPESFVAIECAR